MDEQRKLKSVNQIYFPFICFSFFVSQCLVYCVSKPFVTEKEAAGPIMNMYDTNLL